MNSIAQALSLISVSWLLTTNTALAQFEEIVPFDTIFPVLEAVHFTSDSIGFAVGTRAPHTATVLRTIDAGQSWDTTFVSSGQFQSIHFPTVDTGYAAGWSGIFKTSDGGLTWDSTDFSALIQGIPYRDIHFTDGHTGFACLANSGAYFAQTFDGHTWADSSDGGQLVGGCLLYTSDAADD